MSLKDQKFPIALGLITLVATAGLLWWGNKNRTEYLSLKQSYDSNVGEIGRLSRNKIPPTEENERNLRSSIREFREGVVNLQKSFDKFRQEKVENIDPTEFQRKVLEVSKKVSEEFEKVGTELPSSFYLGFDNYTTSLPPRGETGMLAYELDAYQRLFMMLAEARPTELIRINRIPMTDTKDDQAYLTHTIELSFAGKETALRQLLELMDNSKDYFYVIRSLRIRNANDKAPSAANVKFEQAQSASNTATTMEDSFSFILPDEDNAAEGEAEEKAEEEKDAEEEKAVEEPEPAAASDSSEILKQVLGGEDIQVLLRIDVLQFLKSQNLPEISS